jgi:hypothetical protein
VYIVQVQNTTVIDIYIPSTASPAKANHLCDVDSSAIDIEGTDSTGMKSNPHVLTMVHNPACLNDHLSGIVPSDTCPVNFRL